MRKLVGGILLAAGIPIAGASGLCTLVFTIQSIGDLGSLDNVPLVLIFGGIPLLIGLGLIWAGRILIR